MEQRDVFPSYLAPPDERFMLEALKEAREASTVGEVPVGCVIVDGGQIVARAHNLREQLQDPTAHAEILALTQAAAHREDWRLEGTTLYVTLEPCAMCAGAIVLARVARVVYGAADPKAGACRSLYRILEDPRLNHEADVVPGILEAECGEILRAFFREKRRKT